MTEPEAVQKPRKKRSDAGKTHAKRAPVAEAPIHVRILLKGQSESEEFGCARRAIENGFHVFFYPSERDRYRTTRLEYAISEIKRLEITEAERQPEVPRFDLRPSAEEPVPVGIPQIHAARRGGVQPSIMERLETSSGPIEMVEIPGISIGGHAG